MDAGLYLNLRDELQADATRVERQLVELRRAESFLLRRIKSTDCVRSYQSVLNDLAGEITGAETEHGELLHLERFVTRCLIKAYGDEPPRISEPVQSSEPDFKEPPPPKPDPRKPVPEPHAFGKTTNAQPEREESAAASPRAGLVEFDDDGFPIESSSNGKAASKKNAAEIPRAAPAPAEPPTVIFDENGFPLNPPPADSMNTITEPPKGDAAK